MDSTIIYLTIPILSLIFVLILTIPLRKLAIKIRLVDNPNARKVHKTPIPLVGGITILISSFLALLFSPEFQLNYKEYYVLIIGSAILLLIGIIDDKMQVRSILKLIIQIALAYFVFDSGIRIESLFGVFGIYELPVYVQYFLTIVIIVGVINAFNLMDGIDGLAAGLAIIGLSAFAVIAFITSNTFIAILYLSLIGGLLGFLKFNFSKNHKIFMGDAGSTVIGFIMIVSGIMLIQSAQNTANISLTLEVVIGVLSLPVIDSLRVYRRRIKTGYSPFRADKTHFHHLVLYLGINHKLASLLIVMISLGIALTSIIFGTLFNLTLAVLSILILFMIISKLIAFNYQISNWKTKLKTLEELQN